MSAAWGAGLAAALVALLSPMTLGPGSAAGAATGPRATVAFRFADPEITESSGLVVDDSTGEQLVVTTNDSGDSARVFTVDPATGETVGMSVYGTAPVDVEALAPAGPGEVWVGDIGDNAGERASIEVVRVPVGRGDRSTRPEVHRLVYPGGPQGGPRDAETLLAAPDGRLLVVSKGLLGSEFFGVDLPLGAGAAPDRLELLGPALPFATDGAFFPDGRHLVVRGYGLAAVYAYPSLEEIGTLRLPAQEQGEGVAVDDSGALLLSSEGAGSAVLRLELPPALRRAMAADAGSAKGGPAKGGPADGGPADGGRRAAEPADPGDRSWVAPGVLALLGLFAVGGLVGAIATLRARRTHHG